MLLNFGAYLKILLVCSIQGTTQAQMLADIVGTIDPNNKYNEKEKNELKHKHSVSRLATCKADFPTSGGLTNVVELAKSVETVILKNNFDVVIKHFIEDRKQAVIAALQSLIGSDETLEYIQNGRTQQFSKCMGTSAENVSKAKTVDLRAFLAGIFLFIVLTNDTNDRNKRRLEDDESIGNEFINDDFIAKFLDSDVKIEDLEGNNTVVVNAIPESPKYPEHRPNIGHMIRLDTEHPRYILGNCHDEDWLEFYPSKLYIVSLYFITLKYENEYYLLLNYGSYLQHDESWTDGHIWSVPYTNAIIDLHDKKVRKIKEICSIYEDILKQTEEEAHKKGHISMQKTLSILEEDMFYQLGIVFKDLKCGEEYIEYKFSASESDKKCCYYIREFFVSEIDDAGIINLADPRCLHGHYYLPFSLADKLPSISHKTHGFQGTQGTYQFMGKAIPDNVIDVLTDRKKLLRSIAANVEKSAMLHKETGILFMIAVSESAGVFNASNNKGIIDQQISTALELGMLHSNVKHYMLDNYQITGVMPDNELGKPTDFKDMLEDLYSRLGKIVHSLSVQGIYGFFKKRLLLRCTALYCEYEYGKIFDIASQRPGFAGDGFGMLRLMARETHHVQMGLKEDVNAILFGFDLKDSDLIKFSASRDYQKYDTSCGAKMKFLILDKDNNYL